LIEEHKRGGESEEQPELSRQELKDVERRSAPRTEVVYEAIREEGAGELERSSSTLAWDGLAAGLSMGFSFVAEGLLRSHLPDAEWRPLVSKLGYSAGFLIIVLGRRDARSRARPRAGRGRGAQGRLKLTRNRGASSSRVKRRRGRVP